MLFSYIATTQKGIPKSGEMEANDERDLARILHQEGYILISVKKDKIKLPLKERFAAFFMANRVPFIERLMFTRNLKVIVSAGISLPKALVALSEQSKNKNFKRIILEVSEMVTKGASFSDSISKHPSVFSELFVSMVKVGEESGTLEQSLDILALQMEKSYDLKGKIKGAMIYPAVIISVMIVIGILMMIMVIPQLSKTFLELNIDLPLTTRAVIFMGNSMAKFWFLLPLLFIALFFGFRLVMRLKAGKRMIDKLSLKVPVISSIVKKTNSAYTTRTLGSLISAGVPLVRSLEITAGALANSYYKEAVISASEEVKKGYKLFQLLSKYKNLYPSLVIQMLSVGEETGQTSDMLFKLADFYEEEVSRATKNMSVVIEPFLMIIVGIIVGFFVVSMIQPMYSMMQSLQ